MESKKFKRRWLLEFIGFGYIYNIKTHEIHVAEKITPMCGFRNAKKKNMKYITKCKAKKLIRKRLANGCRYCFSEYDTDMRHK